MDNTTVEGESTKIIRFNSRGGLPLPEGEPINEITHQICDLQFVDISDVPKLGRRAARPTKASEGARLITARYSTLS